MTLIDPGRIPGEHLNLGAVHVGAWCLNREGSAIVEGGADVVRAWQRLPGAFEVTGTEALYTAMTPVGADTAAVGGALSGVASALDAYVDEMGPIKARLDSLRGRAEAFAAKAKAFTPRTEMVSDGFYSLWMSRPERIDHWDEDPDLAAENTALIHEVAQAEADWLDAQQRCADAIRAAAGLAPKGGADERALAAQLRSDDQLATPWGATADRKESCSEKADTFGAHFVWDGIVVGLGWGTVKTLWTLQGFDPASVLKAGHGVLTGDWSEVAEAGREDLAATGAAWLGVAHLASAIAIPIPPAARMSLLHSGALDWLPPEVKRGAEDWTAGDGTALYGTVAGLVGLTLPRKWWDPKAYKADQVFRQWIDNPGGAAGTSVGNIGSFFIPGVGEARAGALVADAGRIGGTGVRVAEGARLGDLLADGSIGGLRGLSADALKGTIKGLSDADAARLARELAKPELDAGALSSLKLDDLTVHDTSAVVHEPAAVHDAAPETRTPPSLHTAPATSDARPTGPAHDAPRTQDDPRADTATGQDASAHQQAVDESAAHEPAVRGTDAHESPSLQAPAHEAPAHEAPTREAASDAPGTPLPDPGTDGAPPAHPAEAAERAPDADSADPGAPAHDGPGHAYSAAVFGPSNRPYYEVPDPTLGRAGRPFFVMPAEDAAVIHDAGSAARYTGMSPSTLDAYKAGDDVYAVLFPTDGIPHAVPSAADAMGWPHFLEGGHTAVLTEGPKAGYLLNPTREFVIAGGTRVPAGSVLVRIGEHAWEVLRRW